ncbi:Serine/threonine-protein kinase pim-2 [Anabarilius grahami]|uniref:non-specific serine/threonine protein kinase n=1 Tax=Anabarilius grahami TaxID=495550 RepID=A0A3N0YWM5_ANAGA|nr:Serine/threonine-protein kinase pim-2 [Anabarilius grahami]
MGQISLRTKKATCAEHVHEQQPCVLLKHTTTTAENHPHQLNETPGGADHTPLQHITIVENPDHQEAPASEVLPDAEEQLEQDVLQPQDVDAPLSSAADESMEELDKDQTSPQHIGEINDPEEAPASQVLHAAEERLEQDILQPLDVDAPAEDDSMDELDNVCCERGVFHRDIKLENVLINNDTLEVKLIDFGCGELMKESAYMAFRGTRVYCPPEYHVNGGYHAKPGTVWSLGILPFATVCGYYPSDSDLRMISEDKWCKPGLSQECCQIISASLQPDPEQRLRLEESRLHDWFKNAGSDRKLSEYTVHHSLLHMGLHSCRPVRVPMLTPVHRRKCQQWAREHQNCTTEQWKKVALYDE